MKRANEGGTGLRLTDSLSQKLFHILILCDTIGMYPGSYPMKYFGFQCSLSTSTDLSLYTVNDFTRGNHQGSYIYVFNKSCQPANASVTVRYSTKYVYGNAFPSPSSTTSNSITWNFSGIWQADPQIIYYRIENNPTTGHLWMGDTVYSEYTITPTTGDIDLSNNVELVIDTVTSSYDPNEIRVAPSCYIPLGVTNLKYTINFENTGNDTAFNISVYDTLSDNVDPESINILMASAVMDKAVFNIGGHNIIKFDFPDINLRDSSHHGECDGAVIFTVNTKPGLVWGTHIYNRAGIYFDYNPVVMTNTVENIIGSPAKVPAVSEPVPLLSPNPVHDELTIKTENNTYNNLTITNLLGQQVISQLMDGTQVKVNVKDLPPGIYVLTLNGTNDVKVERFEKR